LVNSVNNKVWNWQKQQNKQVIQTECFFSFGNINAKSNGKIIIPTTSDSFPVSQFENAYFK
jgi:hypothetical protein